MEQSFGIVPMPKWNADQTRYYHIVEGSCPMYGIPNSKTDATDIGYMLEYFAWEGMETVTPTYKERMLKRRYAQDTESADMLDLIYASKCFDVGYVGNWSGVVNQANGSIDSGKLPKMSAYNRLAKTVPTLIEKDYDAYLNAGKEVVE